NWIVNIVDEFKSPSFRSEQLLHFMVLLFLGLATVPVLLEKRRVTEALWILFLAYCSLVSVRHVTIFALVAAPIVAEELSTRWSAWVRNQRRQSIPRILDDLAAQVRTNFKSVTLWTPAAIVILAVTGSVHWPADFPAKQFPVKLIRRHAGQIAASRIFTSDQWADYLIYLNYPRQRVFMDGRHNYYGKDIANDYMSLVGGHHTWTDLIQGYRFDLVLCEVDSPLASLLKSSPQWQVVEDDGKAVLFQKSAAAGQAHS
ncbi:MAG: hypothetical protein HY238_16250, partial [Acidobacteria bacterium]|nr:hypothetical protein [Acidobacteriota bacterium]